jgi:hypothetical protein
VAAFCVLAAGILVGVRAGGNKHPEQSQGSPDTVPQERPEAKLSPEPANVAAAPDKEKEPAKEQPLTEKQKAAAADAIKALARIEAGWGHLSAIRPTGHRRQSDGE